MRATLTILVAFSIAGLQAVAGLRSSCPGTGSGGSCCCAPPTEMPATPSCCPDHPLESNVPDGSPGCDCHINDATAETEQPLVAPTSPRNAVRTLDLDDLLAVSTYLPIALNGSVTPRSRGSTEPALTSLSPPARILLCVFLS